MRLEVQCKDRIGMVHEILKLFVSQRIDLRLVEVDTTNRCLFVGFPDIDFVLLQELLAALRRLDGVEDVKRVQFSSSERETNTLAQTLEALPDGVIAIDVKGNVTMATELAAQDLGVALKDLLHKPLNSFIKTVNFSRLSRSDIDSGFSKRIRVNRKSLLLEIQPINVSNNNEDIYAGAVIHLKSAVRIDQQSERFRRNASDFKLEQYFKSNMVLSEAMMSCMMRAKRFANLSSPLMISGEVGTGKNAILNALVEYWRSHGHEGGQINRKKAIELQTEAELAAFLSNPGWLVIEGVEGLVAPVQMCLSDWLKRNQVDIVGDSVFRRLIVLTSLSSNDMRSHSSFNYELYLHLAQQNLRVPALRDRPDDLDGLANEILSRVCDHLRVGRVSLSKNAVLELGLYHWPGNIAELKGVLYSAVASTDKLILEAGDFDLPTGSKGVALELIEGSLDKTIKTWEADLLRKLYPKYPSTRKLAKELGMSHSAIANKLRDYSIVK